MSTQLASALSPLDALVTQVVGFGYETDDAVSRAFPRPNGSNPLGIATLDDHEPSARASSCSLIEEAGEKLLERLLCFAMESHEASALARALIKKFAVVGLVLTANESQLSDLRQAPGHWITLLRVVRALLTKALRENFEELPLIDDMSVLYDYLRLSLSHETSEHFRCLFLTHKNRLLKDELLARGTINHVVVYPRELVKRVIELNAGAVILVHNHPSGDPKPSKEDIDMTRLLRRVLHDIGVELHDHVIVGKMRCQSMRTLGLI